jgi:transcriptional adapter 3
MVPVRPPPSAPPTHGPLKVTDVQADFSQVKAPSTTAFATFMAYLEPWTRNIKEEDVGLLEFIPDDLEAFIMPTLGRHYSQVWHDEDTALYGGPLPGTAAVDPVPGPSKPPLKAHPKWEPASLADDDLVGEDRGNGPLTERLVSALLPTPDSVVWKGVKAAEEAMEGRSAGGANAAAARDSMTIGALEDRVRDSMRFLGLIEETVGIFFDMQIMLLISSHRRTHQRTNTSMILSVQPSASVSDSSAPSSPRTKLVSVDY